MGQQSENDNNKNRKYPVIDKRVKETYAKDSKATNRNALSDAYVKFFRWASDRLQGRDGIACFVSNNSFVDQIAFDGMRKHLHEDFTHIYHLDLHGNVRKNPKLSGTTHNVFGIQVGVGITIAVRHSEHAKRAINYFRVPETWTRYDKCGFLAKHEIGSVIDWHILMPDANHAWLTEGLQDDFPAFSPIGSREGKDAQDFLVHAIFKSYGRGVATCRDNWAYNFDQNALSTRIQSFIDIYNNEIDRWERRKNRNLRVDDFVLYDDQQIKWSRDLKLDLQRGHYAEFSKSKVRKALYRPFCKQALFFDRILNEEVYVFPSIYPNESSTTENLVIALTAIGCSKTFHCLVVDQLADLHLTGDTQCFPFYTYDEDGSNRRENITDWALAQFREKYGDEISKWDIFYYIYALLHHPVYRERYAENLKRELPRIPMTVAAADFPAYAEIGRKLADLHLNYETVDEYPLKWIENNEIPFSWRVEKMRLSKDKSTLVVNDSLTLTGFPSECFDYRLGNRSALEWVIDQYKVSTDKRSGITTDPNRSDAPEYIIRLIGRVVTVSMETVKLIQSLPGLGIHAD